MEFTGKSEKQTKRALEKRFKKKVLGAMCKIK